MIKPLVIVGSGGVGREVLACVNKYYLSEYKVVGFIDDGKGVGELINDVPVLGGLDWLIKNGKSNSVIVTIGNPSVRQLIFDKLQDVTLDFPTIIHPKVVIDDDNCKIGIGCYIAAYVVITTDVSIGDFCFINSHCSLQHDTVVKFNCTLMPGVRITGGATIGKNTYISGNTLIADQRTVENNSKL